jgi:hypothetical protein
MPLPCVALLRSTLAGMKAIVECAVADSGLLSGHNDEHVETPTRGRSSRKKGAGFPAPFESHEAIRNQGIVIAAPVLSYVMLTSLKGWPLGAVDWKRA